MSRRNTKFLVGLLVLAGLAVGVYGLTFVTPRNLKKRAIVLQGPAARKKPLEATVLKQQKLMKALDPQIPTRSGSMTPLPGKVLQMERDLVAKVKGDLARSKAARDRATAGGRRNLLRSY